MEVQVLSWAFEDLKGAIIFYGGYSLVVKLRSVKAAMRVRFPLVTPHSFSSPLLFSFPNLLLDFRGNNLPLRWRRCGRFCNFCLGPSGIFREAHEE